MAAIETLPQAPKNWLRGFRSLVDSSLARLDFDDLLAELLNRVRKVTDADTAAILLLDADSQMLVARAASGIEEEIYQNVQVPIGHGFAGRIAAQRRPVMLDKVTSETVTNPILWERGLRTMLGVPLTSEGSVVGVLHIGRLTERPFTREDADLLVIVADRVVLALQAGILKAERAASTLLERSLVPAALPAVPGFEFAARYVTAVEQRGVGGDWYDLFQLPSGEVWISVGDVAGHGLASAVVMGRLRTMIRSHAFQGQRPDQVLRLTDREFQFFDPNEMATAIVAAVSPSSGEIHVCSSGHPPPILALPDRQPRVLELEPDPPLGVGPDVRRSTAVIRFPPGAVLVLYTDGLVERRGESLGVGLDRLRRFVNTDAPDDICRRVMFRLVGGVSPDDDIALVAARRVPTPKTPTEN
jgi:putative methionine-R-sulfoxide reductase with GAF domain